MSSSRNETTAASSVGICSAVGVYLFVPAVITAPLGLVVLLLTPLPIGLCMLVNSKMVNEEGKVPLRIGVDALRKVFGKTIILNPHIQRL